MFKEGRPPAQKQRTALATSFFSFPSAAEHCLTRAQALPVPPKSGIQARWVYRQFGQCRTTLMNNTYSRGHYQGARLCQFYITIQPLPSRKPIYLHRCWSLINIRYPHLKLCLNVCFHSIHLLCFSNRHPNHMLSASLEWCPVHTPINFPVPTVY